MVSVSLPLVILTSRLPSMWVVGLKIGMERGQINVHPSALEGGDWTNAIEYAMEMMQSLYPKQRIEFEFIKEYDNAK